MISTLIVDDEEDVRSLVRMVVEAANEGLVVSGEAANGDEALEHWREQRPVAVVLDQRMPGMSGLEVASHILAENPDQPIILFSAFLDQSTREEARRLGVRVCLDKTQVARLPEELWALVPPG
jgi:two-component system, chemotaxis family, chemotaxis protein CheY